MPFALPTDSAPAHAVALLGNDAVLAARPATPVQLAHACLQAGFHAAIPASWGDELVAAECERQLATRGRAPAIQCSCPNVAARLLAAGAELTPFLVPLAAPPVAAARYLRRLYAPAAVHITYVGDCPGAVDASIDARFSPADFLDALARRGIQVATQPLVFDSVIPPDRRRHTSLPGGLPSPEHLWQTARRTVVELDGEGYLPELAQHLVAGECVLLDVAPRLGCACSGAAQGTPAAAARRSVTALEPPRAQQPPIDTSVDLQIARTLPVLPLAPQPTAPLPSLFAPEIATEQRPPQPGDARTRTSEPPGGAARRRSAPAGFFRTYTAPVPQTRSGEGRALPRAYLARRNSPPLGVRVVTEHAPPSPAADTEGATGGAAGGHEPPLTVAVATPPEPAPALQAAPTAPAPVTAPPVSAPAAPTTDALARPTPAPVAERPALTAAESRWAPPGPANGSGTGTAVPAPPRDVRPAPADALGRLPAMPPRSVPPRGRPTPIDGRRPSRTPATSPAVTPAAVPAPAGGGRFALRLVLLLLAALAGGAALALLVDRYTALRRAPAPSQSQRAPRRSTALPGPVLPAPAVAARAGGRPADAERAILRGGEPGSARAGALPAPAIGGAPLPPPPGLA